MTPQTVLLVEDNPITRKMIRYALEIEGYTVVDAGNGRSALEAAAASRPHLVISDYVLPDIDGVQLMADVRRLLGVSDLPGIVVTGMVSRLEELRAANDAAIQFLAKPVEPSRLLDVVRAQLSAPSRPSAIRRVLVVDDELLNRKLASFRLTQAGYEVVAAAGGAEALELAAAQTFDAILSDVMMPAMDGFAFCREGRSDPRLAAIPIVLVSSAYVDEADRDLARRMGANALVLRTPDLRNAVEALEECLRDPQRPAIAATDPNVAVLHRERIQVQLERQTALNEALLRQGAIQATALSIIRGLSELLAQPKDATQILGDVLVHCLDAAGLSTGLLYLAGPDGRHRLQTQFGLSVELKVDAEGCFGHPELLQQIVETRQPAALTEAAGGATADFLKRLGHRSALVVPFVVLGETFGQLVMGADSQDLSESSWIAFAQNIALQFGQTVALGQSLKRLAESEERYRALMAGASDAIFVLSPEGTILEGNVQAATLLGFPIDQIAGQHISRFAAPALPGGADNVAQFHEAVAGGGRTESVRIRRADGAILEVDFSLSVHDIGGTSYVLSIGRDITEKRSLEAQLLQSQKMESVGRLAGGVAHDFNNLLGVITGYGELLRKRVAEDERLRKYADDILKAARRAADLTRQLLAFSRKQILQPKILDLNSIVTDMERMLRRMIGEDIRLIAALEDRLGTVRADPGQIEQVLMNLAVNARDAMPQGGRLTIETSNVELDAAYARQHSGVSAGRYALLAVSDTGHGMPPEVRARIFEPFFTTKDPGKGTGLGLATVHGIIKQSGGHVSVYSEPGLGTSFKVYLPMADDRVLAAETTKVDSHHVRGSETVLLVEDEGTLGELIRECLETAGYTVLEARHGAEALKLCERHSEPIQLLMTDVVMPGMSGRELAAQVLAIRPRIRVLYMSGYTDDAVVLHGVLTEDMPFLQKPFTQAALTRKVREVLDSEQK